MCLAKHANALRTIEELFMLPPTRAYPKAMSILEERFGNPFLIGRAFRRKLRDWPKIEGRDAKGVRRYGDFLRQCLLSKNEIPNLNILDDEEYNQEMLTKLPDWIVTPWSRIVTNYQKNNTNSYPPFSKFVEYVTEESTVANHPIASVGAVKEASGGNFQKSEKSRKGEEPKKERMKSFKLSSDTNSKCDLAKTILLATIHSTKLLNHQKIRTVLCVSRHTHTGLLLQVQHEGTY